LEKQTMTKYFLLLTRKKLTTTKNKN